MKKLLRTLLVIGAALTAAVGQERYNERYRPQFHFSPAANWTNDPCGLVYAFGKYHLFFQFNPFANQWGHMSWGHAVSADLVHWKQLPVAIPDDEKAAIFTGSSVWDTNNTSGLCKLPAHGCIVSIYTGYTPKTDSSGEKQTQNLAFSQDGLTWTKYSGNPVLDLGRGDTRDPDVFWHEPTRRWIMIIVVASEKKIRLFSSANLREWKPLSEFGPEGGSGGEWECPNLVDVPIQGRPGAKRWVLKIGLNPGGLTGGSGEQYFIGDFDGTTFKNGRPSNEIRWADYGRDAYCTLAFNNQATADAPRAIGWMNNWLYAGDAPTSPWRGSMTLPRSLGLAPDVDGSLRLMQHPIPALASLHGEELHFEGASEEELNRKLAAWPHRSQTFEMEMTARLGDAAGFEWQLLKGEDDEVVLGFDTAKKELYFDRTKNAGSHFHKDFPVRTAAPLPVTGKTVELHVFVDRSSVEVFAQDGAVVMTNLAYPKPTSDSLLLKQRGGALENIEFRMWALRSAWQ